MSTVKQWDEWFEAAGDEESTRTWNVVKSVSTDPVLLDGWATLIEFNRLDRRTPPESPPAATVTPAG
jgi:hypothetical protein